MHTSSDHLLKHPYNYIGKTFLQSLLQPQRITLSCNMACHPPTCGTCYTDIEMFLCLVQNLALLSISINLLPQAGLYAYLLLTHTYIHACMHVCMCVYIVFFFFPPSACKFLHTLTLYILHLFKCDKSLLLHKVPCFTYALFTPLSL